ncbi:hypothetical protein [Lacrimispora saccharolytica]|uniref:hypothetical protein n=1 Tax=Lacrimispora saccharolytica TaxID=84030 RepID=UPI0002DB0384|nr:hypothetical protein [Lacrimispora saccharolytica]QRV19170.1 hypothetical protein I6K70_17155 [Lacrimispora saccharolytica]
MVRMLSTVLMDAREIASGIGEIQSASEEQSRSVSHITDSVVKITAVVQSNSATAQAKVLSTLANQFT